MDLGIEGKVALVTGGSRGFGRACSLLFAKEGVKVGVNYHSHEDAADEVVAAIEETGGKAVAVQGDVSSKNDVERFVAETEEALGPIDILVNNAGIAAGGWSFEKIEEEGWDRVMDVNLKSVWLVSQPVVKGMTDRGSGGVIVNVASVGAYGRGRLSVYSTAKNGVVFLTKNMASELAPRNIRVVSVSPGNIPTDMTSHMFDTEEKRREFVKNKMPLPRLGQPEDVAAAVVFLASDRAKHITGWDLCVSGGQCVW